MATKKTKNEKAGVPATKAASVPDTKQEGTLGTAIIVEAKGVARDPKIQRPAFLQQEGALEKEAPSGFTPIVAFGSDPDNWVPGSWIIGRYLGSRGSIGPNASNMYDLELFDGKAFIPASLWGSTILDNKMRLLNPAIGKWLYVQYLGVVGTSRNQNPAKDFDLCIVNEKHLEKLIDAKKNA